LLSDALPGTVFLLSDALPGTVSFFFEAPLMAPRGGSDWTYGTYQLKYTQDVVCQLYQLTQTEISASHSFTFNGARTQDLRLFCFLFLLTAAAARLCRLRLLSHNQILLA
jgi:hypothetical protein